MSEASTSGSGEGGLPFVKLATEGPGALFRNFFPFVQMAILPILLFMLCWLAIVYLAPRDIATPLAALSNRVMTTLFGMAWLGYLLQPEEGRRYWLPRWSRQHWIFLFYSLCVSAVTLLLGEGLDAIRQSDVVFYLTNLFWLNLAVQLPGDLLHAGIGLAFCALAVRQPGGPLWSWRLLGWSVLKIVVVANVFSLAFTFAARFASNVLRPLAEPIDILGLVSTLPINFAHYASYAVVLGILAFAYRRLAGWHGVQREILERFE